MWSFIYLNVDLMTHLGKKIIKIQQTYFSSRQPFIIDLATWKWEE